MYAYTVEKYIANRFYLHGAFIFNEIHNNTPSLW